MPKDIRVKFRDHFKVDVRAKDVFLFEEELNQNGMSYYVDTVPDAYSDSLVQYYLLDKDRAIVETFSEDKEIIVLSESLEYPIFNEERKFMHLYLKLVGIFILLLMVLKVIDEVVCP